MTYIPLTGASSGGSKPSNWTVRERLRNITKALTAGSSLDLRFAEKFFYQNDALYPAMELMATHSRTSSAWYPNWDFKSGSEVGRLVEYGANERRYGDYGALDEGASTNHIRNPRAEGAVAGTPGTLPTSWASVAPASGIASEVVSSGTEEGWPYIDIRFSGTASGGSVVHLETDGNIFANPSEVWTESFGVRVVGGSTTNITNVAANLVETEMPVSYLRETTGPIFVPDAVHRRLHLTVTTGASTGALTPRIRVISAGAIDITLRIYTPQLEQSATPTSPILPTAGTPAAATRAADVVTGVTTDRASRGWYDTKWDYTNGGECGDLLEFLPGVPRVGPQGLLVEEGTTNQIRNPRCGGAVAGTPGTPPTNWAIGTGGATSSIVGSGVEDGWPYVDVRWNGTSTSDPVVVFDSSTQASASNGETWTGSVGVKLVAGSLSNIDQMYLAFDMYDSGASLLARRGSSALTSPDANHHRVYFTYTLDEAATASVQQRLFLQTTGSVAIDVTLRIYAPQLEQKAYPTSVVLPEAGSPAAATRAADDIERGNGDWASDTSFSVFGEFVLNTVAQDGSPFSIASGGSDRTDILACEGGDLKFRYRSNGVTDASQIIRSAQVAETVRSAIGVDAAEVAVSVSGAASQTFTPTDVLPGASLSFGKAWPSAATAGSFFIKSARYWPYRFSNSELEALVA